MYPSFSKLSAGAEALGGPFDMLDGDTLQKILGDETCDTVLGVCSVNHPLRDQCNEAFFKAASGRMGFGSPEGGGEGQPPAPSWSEFFAKSCRWLRRARDATDVDSDGFYLETYGLDPVGKWASLQVLPNMLEYVPKDRSDYGDLAKIAVTLDGWALKFVPTDSPDFGEMTRIAVAHDGWALKFVPKDLPDYGEIARIAVAKNGDMLRYVPKDLPDYGEIAKIAVEKDGLSLRYVPKDHPDYGALAGIAVTKDGWALKYVPRNHPDYDEIAKLAQ